MSNKEIHLYVMGDGDPELQAMIEQGLTELGHHCSTTAVASNCATLLDALSVNALPIIIKPYNSG